MNVTQTAIDKIKHHLSHRGKGIGIRIGVHPTGCSGFAYKLEFADTVDPDDIISDHDGFSVLIDPKAYKMLEGMTVDYQRKGLNEGFEFINPLEKARCGCGESFTI